MKALGRDRRTEVEVDGVPGHIAERRWSMSSTEGHYMLMRWRHVGAEVVDCGQIFGVDAANRLHHPPPRPEFGGVDEGRWRGQK